MRIPHMQHPKGRRVEVRFPDSTANPYLAFTAMLMAGLDGIANKINPGPPSDKDLYDLPPEEEKLIPTVSYSLEQSLEALDKDRGFLTAGGVLNDSTIDAYIALEGAGDHPLLDDAASRRVRDVLQPLGRGSYRGSVKSKTWRGSQEPRPRLAENAARR